MRLLVAPAVRAYLAAASGGVPLEVFLSR